MQPPCLATFNGLSCLALPCPAAVDRNAGPGGGAAAQGGVSWVVCCLVGWSTAAAWRLPLRGGVSPRWSAFTICDQQTLSMLPANHQNDAENVALPPSLLQLQLPPAGRHHEHQGAAAGELGSTFQSPLPRDCAAVRDVAVLHLGLTPVAKLRASPLIATALLTVRSPTHPLTSNECMADSLLPRQSRTSPASRTWA